MSFNFDNYAREGKEFMHRLASELGHPDREDQVAIALRAVLHALRDRISIGQNLHVLSHLPMFLKAIYVNEWSYGEEVDRIKSREEFERRVEKYQAQYGESRYDWNMSTSEIITIVMAQLERYIPEGEVEDVKSELPDEIAALI